MTIPTWFVSYCKDFEKLYDSWLLVVEDPNRQTEAAELWEQLESHRKECKVCIR